MNAHKKKKFLNLPQYGEKSHFVEFIKQHLRYPKEALENKIEGEVFVEYKVNHMGEVVDAWIKKGLGFGCDEEALRVVKMIRYQEARNRGLRVTTNHKIKIRFKLPAAAPQSVQVKMEYKEEKKQPPSEPQKTNPVYSYTVTLNSSNQD